MLRISAAVLILSTLCFYWTVGAARAQQGDFVDLELVLAVDISASVDNEEYDLQMRGLAAAFRHPDVLSSIRATAGGVAVSLVQWSDRDEQLLAIDWMHVFDADSAANLAHKIRNTPRLLPGGQTAISGVIDFSLNLLETNSYDGWRKVVDVSGDGRANAGPQPMAARDRAMDRGVTINGLAIRNEEPFVDSYYRRSVIGGTNSFLMVAEDYEDFAAAILEKLIKEIGAPLANHEPEPANELAAAAPRVNTN